MRFAPLLALLLLTGCTLPPSGSTKPDPTASGAPAGGGVFLPNVTITELGQGLRSPVDLVPLPEPGNFLLAEQEGRLSRLTLTGDRFETTPIADLAPLLRSGGEQGLLGIALHPRFGLPQIGSALPRPQLESRLYLNYTRRDDGATVIAVARLGLARATLQTAPVPLLVIEQPYANHNAGDLVFTTDGQLLVPTGDGGAGNDPENRSQDPDSLLGKLLLLDVDPPTATPTPTIVGLGLRNPWRVSVDPRNGALWIVDVGQGAYEEVNRLLFDPSAAAANFGWRIMEGDRCRDDAACTPPADHRRPVGVYSHDGGACSVIGGAIATDPVGERWFLFTDWCDGKIRVIRADALDADPERAVTVIGDGLAAVAAIIADPAGGLLALDHGRGRLLRLTLTTATRP